MKEETIKREKKEEREIIKERRDKRGRKRELMKREACASHLAIARPAGHPPIPQILTTIISITLQTLR